MNNDTFITQFEQQLAEYAGAPYAVVTDRCTNAIVLCLEYLRHTGYPMDTLAIPTNTYISVPMTLLNYGYNISLEHIQWAGQYQIGNTPVYDSAIGFDEGMYIPGSMQCLSFQQKKRLAIGKGGAILCDDKQAATTLRRMRHDGRDSSVPVVQDIENIIHGYHMNMSPAEAATGLLLLNQPLPPLELGGDWSYPDAHRIPSLSRYYHAE